MKTRRPLFTYILTFLNGIITPLLAFLLAACYVYGIRDTDTGVESQATFIEIYTTGFIVGGYLCRALTLLYFLSIQMKWLRPRWWSNLGLIIASYAVIYLSSILPGVQDPVRDAASIIGDNYWSATGQFIVMFIIIAVTLRIKAAAVQKPAEGDTPSDPEDL